jgi:hypothetical protein
VVVRPAAVLCGHGRLERFEVLHLGADVVEQAAREVPCASPLVKVPGQVRGLEVLAASATADSNEGWAQSRYGFGTAVDGPYTSIPAKDRITFSNCQIAIGPAAQADPIASKWPDAVAHEKYPTEACLVGTGN